jgi:hypothetical protein
MNSIKLCTAFDGTKQIASGHLWQVASQVTTMNPEAVLIFDDLTGDVIDLDLRGMTPEAHSHIEPAPEEPHRGPGRPRLGVVAREVTLLPRHWDWLGTQPGGASVALRRLVEQARKSNQSADRLRQAQEAAYRFMSAMAGNEAGFEEAARALFAGNREAFSRHIDSWPHDVGNHAKKLAAPAFEEVWSRSAR